MIEIAGFTKSYGHDPILEAIDLRVEPGENLVVIGPSGCGKSTLLRHAAGLEDETTGPIEGRISIGDIENVPGASERFLRSRCIRGPKIGFLFQEGALAGKEGSSSKKLCRTRPRIQRPSPVSPIHECSRICSKTADALWYFARRGATCMNSSTASDRSSNTRESNFSCKVSYQTLSCFDANAKSRCRY